MLRGCADKSSAQPTSRYRWKDSMLSLEWADLSCAELQVFSCYRGLKEVCEATRAISTTSRRELSISFFISARQDAEGNSLHSDRDIRWTCAIECHPQKLGGQFKRGDFYTCVAPCPERLKTVTTSESIEHIHELNFEDRRISSKSVTEQPGISRERVVSIIHEDLNMRTFSAKWFPNCLNAELKRQECRSSEQHLKLYTAGAIQMISCCDWCSWTNLCTSLWPEDKATIHGVAA